MDNIINLYVQQVVMEEIKFSEVPDKIKDAVEQQLIESGLGFYTIKETYKEEI